MATAQALKKKLRGIRSIQKVSKAMKTAATVKFSRLNGICGDYAIYVEGYRRLYENNKILFDRVFAPADPDAPVCFVIMAGNKGMCGSFNAQLLLFAEEELKKEPGCRVLLCGERTRWWFHDRKIPYDRAFVFDDVPRYESAQELFGVIWEMLGRGEISRVEMIWPEYQNMIVQNPVRGTLLGGEVVEEPLAQPMFFPDRESVVWGLAPQALAAFLYERILECALGAQAATLMTMRSAYDTSVEYSRALEGEINRKRQSQVTADVLETSSELSREVN